MTDVIIENARIIDGTGKAPFHGHIVIEQGAITMVGDLPADGLIKPGLKRINAKGKTVMPGLIDTHCHLSFDDAGSNSEIFFQRRGTTAAWRPGPSRGRRTGSALRGTACSVSTPR